MTSYGVKTEPECMPCFSGQISRTLQHAGVNGERERVITRMAESIIAAASPDQVPARTSTMIHRLLRRETGVDPYKRLKDEYNRIALAKLPGLRQRVTAHGDRLEGSVRAAIAGNVIDFGIYDKIDLDKAIDESFLLPFPSAVYADFAGLAAGSRRILYLCDNAGEIAFDLMLLETLRNMGKPVTAAVKGSPVINDATLEDAAAVRLSDLCEVIDNGNDGIGTLLEECSPRFMDAYRSADLIISKGQANYETLMQTGDDRLFFLFKVKCPVVARTTGRKNGDIVLLRNAGRRDK